MQTKTFRLACLSTALLSSLASVSSARQSADLQPPIGSVLHAIDRTRCATPAFDPTRVSPLAAAGDCSYSSTNPTSAYAPDEVYQVDIVVHVIQSTSGQGFLSAAQIESQIDVLNEDFRALSGTPGGLGVDTKIQFRLASKDPAGNPTSGITYSTNNSWFQDNGNYWSALAWDTSRYLNMYTNEADGALGYVPDIPQGGVAGKISDRVVMYWKTIGLNSSIGAPYNLGRTATHEVGHYLGLYHTFDGGCGSSSACYTTGDRICDTNRDSAPHYGCGPQTSCGSPDPVNNYMDYSDDICMSEFTQEQARRMRCTLESYRSGLIQPDDGCQSASVASRSGGSNIQTYTAGAPSIGSTVTAQVNLFFTGMEQVLLFGYAASSDISLGSAQLLVNVSGAELLHLPAKSDPVSLFSIPIPNVPELCGFTVYTQALHFSADGSYSLSNSQDLTLGT